MDEQTAVEPKKVRMGKRLRHVEELFSALEPVEQSERVFRALCSAKGIDRATVDRHYALALAVARRLSFKPKKGNA